MDRRIRGLMGLAGACLTLASIGCQGAFHRRGIPPEPKVARDGGPAQFNSDPRPFQPPPQASPAAPGSPYAPSGGFGAEPTPPVGEPSGSVPGITNPGNSVGQPGVMGAPGTPPSPL